MATYSQLPALLRNADRDDLAELAGPYLIEVWLADYARRSRNSEIIETTQNGCSYLFDIAEGRLIAAWAISHGAHRGKRDKGRMRGHPQGFGSRYHRGHAIPHSAGGPADINLVAQLGSINVGAFRVLEREAVATPGSLYFTHWIYSDQSQKPTSVEQGLLRAGCPPDIIVHRN